MFSNDIKLMNFLLAALTVLRIFYWQDCDSGWMMYNGHYYFRKTTKMSQHEAMVMVKDKWIDKECILCTISTLCK